MCHHSQLSAHLCFVLFFQVFFNQCLEIIQPVSPDFLTHLNTQGQIKDI